MEEEAGAVEGEGEEDRVADEVEEMGVNTQMTRRWCRLGQVDEKVESLEVRKPAEAKARRLTEEKVMEKGGWKEMKRKGWWKGLIERRRMKHKVVGRIFVFSFLRRRGEILTNREYFLENLVY